MKEDLKVYEIGFHLSPSLEEGEVEAKVASIKEAITKNGGNSISEETPKMVNLAYTIEVHSDAGNKRFDKAYFGWVKFEMEPEKVSNMSTFAKADKGIIRFIVVKTDKGNTVLFHKAPVQAKKDVSPDELVDTEAEPALPVVAEKPASEEEIDKTIEDLVVI